MRALPAARYLEFVYTAFFERTRKGVLTDDEMKVVEDEILENPRRGAVMGNTRGVRKIRAAQKEQGKSGSARVAYLYLEERDTVFFLLAFPKNVQGNLTDAQKRAVRNEVDLLLAEEWPRKKPRK